MSADFASDRCPPTERLGDESLRVPERSGEVLCIPPVRAWRALGEENAARLDRNLRDFPLSQLRALGRQEVVAAAVAFSSRWGITSCPGGPLLVTGHQPVFFHPGIWVKNLLLGLCEGVCGLHLIVDTDEVETLDAAIPRRDGRLGVVRRPLLHLPAGVPFEAAPPPSASQWDAFIEAVRADVATLGLPELVERVERTGRIGAELATRCEHLGEFMALLRRALEPQASYLELPVSRLSRTAAFLHFAAWLVRSCESFWQRHNEALDAYRRRLGIRSPAQPFPNLRQEAGRYELPLWAVQAGRRHPVFAGREGERVVLWVAGRPVCALDPRTPPEVLGSLELRPRAITLTMFVRLVVADLFVHGVGGARYDRATDAVIRQVLELEPPAYAVATATFHLPLGDPRDPDAERAALKRRLQTLLHNPDRVLDPVPEPLRPLVEEKWRLIRRLEGDDLTRRERREATRRIRAINATLAQALEDEIARVRAALDRLDGEQAEHEAVTYREYPFFLFDGRTLAEALREAVYRAGG